MSASKIFSEAKRMFVSTSDQSAFGKAEYWASYPELQAMLDKTGKLIGDCEDYASWCVHKLREAGLPARFVLCQTETGEWHCVAETDGDVLDNRQDFITPQDKLPYKWHSISGFGPREPWHRVIS